MIQFYGAKVKTHYNRIIAYLEEKQKANFTGSVKLSFENGEIVAVNEANKHDLPKSKNEKGVQLITDYLRTATDKNFNGAVVFVFNSGKCTDYSYSRTYKGDTLKFFLGA